MSMDEDFKEIIEGFSSHLSEAIKKARLSRKKGRVIRVFESLFGDQMLSVGIHIYRDRTGKQAGCIRIDSVGVEAEEQVTLGISTTQARLLAATLLDEIDALESALE